MTMMSEDEDPSPSVVEGEVHCTDRRLLEFLVCPVTKGPLVYDAAKGELISKRAGLAFPIRDGVPLLTEDSARQLNDP